MGGSAPQAVCQRLQPDSLRNPAGRCSPFRDHPGAARLASTSSPRPRWRARVAGSISPACALSALGPSVGGLLGKDPAAGCSGLAAGLSGPLLPVARMVESRRWSTDRRRVLLRPARPVPAGGFQLADVPPAEAAQEGAGCSRCRSTSSPRPRWRAAEPGVGYQTGIVEGNPYAVGMITC